MSRLAIVVPSVRSGGAERTMLALAPRLAARGLGVDLVVLTSFGTPDRSFPPPAVRTVELRARRVAAALPSLVRWLRRERPDCLLSTGTHANVVAAVAAGLARRDGRLVLYEQNTVSRLAVAAHRRRDRLLPALAARAYRRADAVVAPSEGVAADLRTLAGLAPGLTRTIPYAVDRKALRARAAEAVDHPWLQPGEPPVILAVGRLEAVKDHATLIRAFARLRAAGECRLLVLGEGRERRRLEGLAGELGVAGDVGLPGWVPNPYAFMGRCAALAHPSLREALPTVLLEGLALGIPVVASDCESGPREILGGGRLGTLVPPADLDGLTRALAAALAEPRPGIPVEALARYAPERVVDAWLEVLHDTRATGAQASAIDRAVSPA